PDSNNKIQSLKSLTDKFSADIMALKNAIIERQRRLASENNDTELFICKLISPLVTGLGNPHPIENGFSFLTPYGLPYLAGSGIKGALRHAAELMALFPDEYNAPAGFCILDVWWLFGFEGSSCAIWPNAKDADVNLTNALASQQKQLLQRADFKDFMLSQSGNLSKNTLEIPEKFLDSILSGDNSLINSIHLRGALTFWDAFPDCDSMDIEIMTPHYSSYYQNDKPPHDAGQPTPIPFLAVPAGKEVGIIIQCETRRLPQNIKWQNLAKSILSVGLKWNGFGAKTAIGYGAIEIDLNATERIKKQGEEAIALKLDEQRKSNMRPEELNLEEFKQAFESIKEKEKVYKPGQSQLDIKRNDFLKNCLSWTDSDLRKQAALILEETFIWGKPTKTDKKNELRQKIDQLKC
ncbi:type III-B CRISPR module RAMP protein Cmr6, partial [bacterium]|nr:type III-B CRISPR module RAMP protein Cmr6 [bacterium]